MTERANCVFAAIGFKALDYVFEASTRLKVTWDLLALPEPYLSSTCDLFPFVHQLFKETYRTLLVGVEQVIFSGESVLDDLRKRNQPFASLERYKYESEEEEFIPSSNPDSVNDFDLSLLKEPEVFCDPLLEIFSKLVHPKEQEEDLFLAEDLIVDHLPHFRRLLPSLTSNLSRLKTLPVADPLLTPGGLVISEDHVFRSYETFLDADTVDVQMSSFIQEDFLPESLLEDEDLLLPEVVDTLLLERPKVTPMTSFSGLWNVFPEPLEEECSVLDILRRTSAQRGWTDMFPFDPPQEDSKEKNTKTSLMEFSGDLDPTAEIEVELVLSISPKKSSTNIRFSVTELQEEELSPFTLSLMSPRTRTAMETAVWKAEKHPAFVERFLLSEPLTDDPAGGFQHLREASRLFKSELLSSIDTFDEMELQLDAEIPQLIVGQSIEFTEKLSAGGQRSEAPPTLEEEFIKLEPEQEEVGSILPHFTNEGRLQKEVTVDSPPIKLLESVNSKEDSLSAETTEKLEAKRPFMLKNKRVRWSEQTERPPTSTTKTHKPHQELDPLSTFMMLRSQQVLPAAASPQGSAGAAAEENGQTEETEPPPCAHRGGVMLAGGAVTESEDAGRQQKPHQWTSQLIVRQECPSSRVVRVQAAESQRRAYQELLAFARPRLDSVRQLGLRGPVWGDFSCLAPDQTHFLLKQQEKALRSTSADDAALLRDQELLLSQVVLIHVLVTFKELLLKCDLSSGLVYLSRAAESCADPSLKLLLRKLNIILFLAQKNQESNNKLLELQQLLAAWLRSRTSAEKILVILSVDSDENRSTVLSSLSRVTDAAVTCVRPDEDKVKLNGAGVVSSVCGCDCALVFEQHIGPDFPWTCFSVVVEFDHPGQSPWSAVCSQNSIQHLTFDAVVTDSGPEEVSWCLEENVPYVLFVTEELLNCPSLLQTLESSFNVAVVERSPHPSLQMLGGTHNYAVITVDESTAVVIQELEELDQDRASEVLVMRLTALSLQYNCCWLVLFCPDGRGGRFSSETFSNLALVYSSLVLFGMKPEDLDVKVLMVSDVTEMAKSINRICFTTMMRSDWDPVRYLSRDWLTVIPSQDEECLSQFPCVNPLVGQLMLSRFPSLLRLLSASLSELTELLPEVPQKVLKLFRDITSLYSTSDPAQPHTPFFEANPPATPSNGLWTDSGEQMRLCGGLTPNFLCEADGREDFFCRQDAESVAFKLDLSGSFCSPDVHLQSSWTRTWTAETQNPRSRAGAAGRVVERLPEDRSPTFSTADFSSHLYGLDSPLNLDFSFSQSPTLNHLLHSPPPPTSTGHSLSLSPPPGAFWSTVCSHEGTAASDSHGSRIWRGRERRRSRDAAGLDGSAALPPLKMGRLSCEKVPGRSDGQTRLRLF
ncbi:protein shortage in chiasmata 1 ortholog [Oryzias melastigma]|uniref:protein shortage in chiasmata 1 ortholog n=1 Tax=Oryzias melastigma TaxID=30732 RepID=UPI000CF8048D|nr:protein shortage in chiasmata 1 ortholog [Oryzias melastigma]